MWLQPFVRPYKVWDWSFSMAESVPESKLLTFRLGFAFGPSNEYAVAPET